jgi:glycosyltransferase involved in cell wall biosynthesis
VRILLTVHQFLPEHGTGTEVLTWHVGRELQRLGHEVRVATARALPIDAPVQIEEYVYDGLPVVRYGSPRGVESFADGSLRVLSDAKTKGARARTNVVEREFADRDAATWFGHIVDDWRPDLVQIFHLRNLSALAIDACHARGIPMVMTPTDFWLVCPTTQLRLLDGSMCRGPDDAAVNCLRHAAQLWQSGAMVRAGMALPDAALRMGLSAASRPPLSGIAPFSWASALSRRARFTRERAAQLDCIVAPTLLMERVLRDNNLHAKRMVVSRFGIDLAPFDGLDRRTPTAPLRVGFIGTLAQHKGAHVLVDAILRLPNDVSVDVQLYGAGTGAYVDALRDIAAGDTRLRFCGTFAHADIGRVLAGIDVLVIPSIWYENSPLVLYSAQAAGCAVVASNVAGLAEFVRDNVDGRLFPAADADALAGSLAELARDPAQAARMGAAAPRPKSVSAYAGDLLEIYRSIIAEREATP